MIDKIEKINDSVIQHGKFNDRIYLMKLDKNNVNKTIKLLEKLREKNNYSKIFAKVPEPYKKEFLSNGFVEEAFIPEFCDGKETIFFLSKFYSDSRKKVSKAERIDDVLRVSKTKKNILLDFFPENIPVIKELKETDADAAASLYKKVFATYPFPIYKPEYLIKTMKENIKYFYIKNEINIIALASSEIDYDYKNVEMTDFAVLPECRGKNYAVILLNKMEEKMKKIGIKTAYTIARAVSYGMNSTFAKMNYSYSGTLINNTNISGNLESMNVWFKKL
jgi:beta-lysine N6-acetyltransferase